MKLTSMAFETNGKIPSQYTCDGEGVNPPLIFSDVPPKALSLVLLMDDPDIPESAKNTYNITAWDHWVVFNIPPDTKMIAEDSIPNGIVGVGTRGVNAYTPPCPPDREHRYVFRLYALDRELKLRENATKADVQAAMQRHILAEAGLIGRYERK